MQRANFPLLTVVLLLNLGAACRTFAQTTYTWDGGGADSNWSTGANWVGNSAPTTAYNFLHFAGTSNLNATNNLGDYGAGYRIYFDAGAGAFTLGGNAIKFYENGTNAPLIENDSTSLQTLAFRIGVTNPFGLDIKAVTGDMAFSSGNSIFFDYNNNNAPGGIRVDGGAGRTVTFNDALIDGSGSGSLTVGTSATASTFTTVLKAVSTYTGTTTVNGGILAIGAGGSLYNGGNNAGAITINNGGTLRFDRNDIFGNSSNTSAVVVTVNAGGTVASNGSINVLRNPVFNGGTLLANGGFVGASIGVGGTVTIGGTQATNFVIGTITTDDNVIIGQEGLSSSFTTFNVGDVTTGSDLIVQTPLQNNFGTSAGLTKNGLGTMELDGANTYNNTTTIDSGELLFGQNGNSNSSAIVLGDSGGSNAAVLTLGGSSAQTITSAVTVQTGNTGAQIIRSLNTSGASSLTGTVTLQRDVTAAAAQAGGTLQFATVVSSDATTRTVFVGDTNIANAGTVSFTGTADNTNIGVTVNSGTFLLGKTSSGLVHAVGSALTVNSGATATLGGSGGDQIYSGAAVTINSGGKFLTAGLSEGSPTIASTAGVGALTLAGGATLDFGSGANGSTLSAASGVISGTGTISILDWTGTPAIDLGLAVSDRLLYVANPNFSASQLAQVQFYNDANVALGSGAAIITYNGFYELVPTVAVPEPGTWLGGAALLGLAGWGLRKRLGRPGMPVRA